MTPYYSDEHVTLYHADCRDGLASVTRQLSAAFCFTDPPYNVGMDYGKWNDDMADAAYLEFCQQWIDMVKAGCQELCIYPPRKYLLDYWNMLGRDYKQIALTWTPEGAIRYGFVNQHTLLLTNAKPKKRTKDHWHNLQMRGMGYFFRENDYGHPGYTSEDLTTKALVSLASPDQVVIEPFSGTGTTLRCAKNLGRKAIGFEVNEAYCEITANRMAQMVLLSEVA